jgi:hypothetical protein
MVMKTCIIINPEQINNCDLGEMKFGRFADFVPALKILDIRLVFVKREPYTTLKHIPTPAF